MARKTALKDLNVSTQARALIARVEQTRNPVALREYVKVTLHRQQVFFGTETENLEPDLERCSKNGLKSDALKRVKATCAAINGLDLEAPTAKRDLSRLRAACVARRKQIRDR